MIKGFLDLGCRVTIASDGFPASFLQSEFPGLQHVELPSSKVRYPTGNMAWNIFLASPSFLMSVRREKRIVEKLVASRQFDAILSDNRYGCWSKDIPSILVTHQLQLPVMHSLSRKIAQGMLNRWLTNFQEIWVPDAQEDSHSLAGRMSGSGGDPRVKYLGWLTTMRRKNTHRRYMLIAILSGPEPQRSHLEEKVLEGLERDEIGPCLLVRGISGSNEIRRKSDRLSIVDFLQRERLNEAIEASDFVLCRSGYSSLMDLVCLGKKAILIPTPDQPEQEVLATQAIGRMGFVNQQQDGLDLKAGLIELRSQDFSGAEMTGDQYFPVLKDFIQSIT